MNVGACHIDIDKGTVCLYRKCYIICSICNIRKPRCTLVRRIISDMDKLSAALLALCEGNSPTTGVSPDKEPIKWTLILFMKLAWTNLWTNSQIAMSLDAVTFMLRPCNENLCYWWTALLYTDDHQLWTLWFSVYNNVTIYPKGFVKFSILNQTHNFQNNLYKQRRALGDAIKVLTLKYQVNLYHKHLHILEFNSAIFNFKQTCDEFDRHCNPFV